MLPQLRVCAMLALLSTGLVTATLDPATSNTKCKYPTALNCTVSKISRAIQAAECSHNTRVAGTQTFAIFKTDHQYDGNNGAPYGTCEAYTCEPGPEMTADEDYWTFYWGDQGEEEGEGAGCIKSPEDGTCGCENSDGTFVPGGTDCK